MISNVQWQHTKSALTPILDFFLSSEVVTTWQTDSAAHKLKPRSFHKSTQLQVHLADFHPQCELCLIVLSDSQVCCCFWAVPSAKQSLYFQSPKMASSCHNSSTSTPVPLLGTPFNTISHFSDHLAYSPNAPW